MHLYKHSNVGQTIDMCDGLNKEIRVILLYSANGKIYICSTSQKLNRKQHVQIQRSSVSTEKTSEDTKW